METTNPVNTVKSRRNAAGLCSPLRGGALIAAPPGEDKVGQRVTRRSSVGHRALDGCVLTAVSSVRGTPASSQLHQPAFPQMSGPDWLLSSSARDKRTSHQWSCPLLFFLFFERLFQSLFNRQAKCDLDVMSFGFLSVSVRTTCIHSEEFRSILYIL